MDQFSGEGAELRFVHARDARTGIEALPCSGTAALLSSCSQAPEDSGTGGAGGGGATGGSGSGGHSGDTGAGGGGSGAANGSGGQTVDAAEGDVQVDSAPPVTNLAMWTFHGGADTIVSPAGDNTDMPKFIACPQPPRKDVRYTVYPGVDHDAWTRTYDLSAGNDIYAWLSMQKR